MDCQGMATQARAESVLLGLWAKSFYRPTTELARELRDGVFVADVRNLLSGCEDATIDSAIGILDAFAESLKEKDLDAARLELEVDYNRLFVGPSALLAPPYESFYVSARLEEGERGTVRGAPEREVNAEYAAHGLAMPTEFVEFPDHIAVELEYLSLLAKHEAEAWESGDEEAALALQDDQESFRTEHLGTWIEPFVRNVAGGAKTAFYPVAAVLVQKTAL